MSSSQQSKYVAVDASPVKSFFVSMLTRDIQLEEAILDLLDNCVDGVLRSKKGNGTKPYEGFKAEITFGADSFSISDNCGGIPWDLHEYAFRMGRSPDRPPDAPGSVGVYGIGMKRAIFKIGRHCLVSTRNAEDQYEVEISPDWISNEAKWDIPVREADLSTNYDGTTIVVGELYPGIAKTFAEGAKSFKSDLKQMIATHYAYIMDKGFEVTVNGDSVRPRTTKLVYDRRRAAGADAIRPFVFKTAVDGVEVYVAVGFTRPIPSENELKDEQVEARYSSIDAGWTILCNDRAILYCDRSELTGWGKLESRATTPSSLPYLALLTFGPKTLPNFPRQRPREASMLRLLYIFKSGIRCAKACGSSRTTPTNGRGTQKNRNGILKRVSLLRLKN